MIEWLWFWFWFCLYFLLVHFSLWDKLINEKIKYSSAVAAAKNSSLILYIIQSLFLSFFLSLSLSFSLSYNIPPLKIFFFVLFHPFIFNKQHQLLSITKRKFLTFISFIYLFIYLFIYSFTYSHTLTNYSYFSWKYNTTHNTQHSYHTNRFPYIYLNFCYFNLLNQLNNGVSIIYTVCQIFIIIIIMPTRS